ELRDNTERTKDENEEFRKIGIKLRDLMPGIVTGVNKLSGAYEINTEAARELNRQNRALAKAQILAEVTEAEKKIVKLSKAHDNLNEKQRDYSNALVRLRKAVEDGTTSQVGGASAVDDMGVRTTTASGQINKYSNMLKNNLEAIEENKTAHEGYVEILVQANEMKIQLNENSMMEVEAYIATDEARTKDEESRTKAARKQFKRAEAEKKEREKKAKDLEKLNKKRVKDEAATEKKIAKEKEKALKLEENIENKKKEVFKRQIESRVDTLMEAMANEKMTIGSVAAALIKAEGIALAKVMAIKAIAAGASLNFVQAGLFIAAGAGILTLSRAAATAITSGARRGQAGIEINEPIVGVGLRTGERYTFGEAGTETVTPGPTGEAGEKESNIYISIAGDFIVKTDSPESFAKDTLNVLGIQEAPR
ncbi:MAG: hypothetical protein V3U02_01500, partial [Calditrichia bacterium]